MSVVPLRKPRDAPAPEPAASEGAWTLGETAQETALRHSISIHCPNQDMAMMGVRVALAKMRDRAGAGLSRAGDTAGVMLAQASAVAATWVYAPADFRTLSRITAAVGMTIEAAAAMERALRDGR
jgi:hypothetical protein